MQTERFRIWAGFFIICTVWGSTWLAIKIGLQTVPPFLGASARFFVASGLLLLIVRSRRIPIPFTREARRVYLSLGFLSFAIPYALVYWGEQYVDSGLTSILFSVYPFSVAIISHFLLERERLDGYKIGGIVAAFFGIIVIFAGDIQLAGANVLLAMGGILLSAVSAALSLVLIKKWGQPFSPFVMNLVGMSIGAVAFLFMSLALESPDPAAFDLPAILSILYLAVFGSVLAFVAYHWLLKRVEAVYLSLTSFINPLVAVLLGAAVLGEILSFRVLLGALFVLGGIAITNGGMLAAKFRRSS